MNKPSNLGGIDLNLLVALDALLAERSVTRAAKRVGLSQPAMSNALGRLRALLDDPVLVRTRGDMQPTQRALDIAPAISDALRTIERAVAPTPAFDPANSQQSFRIQTADSIELTLVPRLVAHLKAQAPQVTLSFQPVTKDTADLLRRGRVDLFVGNWFGVPGDLQHHVLSQDSFSCIARKDHPVIGTRLTTRQFVSLGHVVVEAQQRPGKVLDNVFADDRSARRVVVRTPHFLVAPLVVARSDLIATLPTSVATAFAEILPLQVHRPPIDVSGFANHMVWHGATTDSPAHRWLRQVIMDLEAQNEDW